MIFPNDRIHEYQACSSQLSSVPGAKRRRRIRGFSTGKKGGGTGGICLIRKKRGGVTSRRVIGAKLEKNVDEGEESERGETFTDRGGGKGVTTKQEKKDTERGV